MNQTLFLWAYGLAHQNFFLDKIIIFCAVWLPYLLIIGLGVFLLMHHDKPSTAARDLFVILIAAFAAWAVARIIKIGFPLPRPFFVLQGVHPLFIPDDMQAFPSGHATFFSALAAALYLYHRRLGLWFVLAALLIGFARVAAGVHWPGDILGGYIIGTSIGAGVYFLLRRLHLQNSKKPL